MAVAALLALVLAGGGFALYLNRPRTTLNLASDGLALEGYDPVSYFPEAGGVPQRGNPQWSTTHADMRYQFESEVNRDRFLAAPSRYQPEFGGWCAYAVAHGYKFEVDPLSFKIVDDRLLLFYRGAFGDARSEFEKEGAEEGLRSADQHWPQLAAG